MPNDIPTAVFEADFDAVETRQSVTFTYASAQCSGVRHKRVDSDKTEDAGFLREYDFAIECKLSQAGFSPTAPTIGSVFSALLGKSFKVQTIDYSPCGLVAVYNLDTIHK